MDNITKWALIGTAIAIILILLLFPLVSAADLNYRQKSNIDIQIPCVNNGKQCSASANCTITIFYPNSTILVNNELMTNQGNYHNYTLISEQTSILGNHEAIIYCIDVGGLAGYISFTILISPTGNEPTLNNAIIPGILLIAAIILIYFSISLKEGFIKPLLMFVSLFMILISINFITLSIADPFLQSNINTIYQIIFWSIIIIMGYFVIQFMLEMVSHIKLKNQERQQGGVAEQ